MQKVETSVIFSAGFSTDILAVVALQPEGATAQVSGEGGKPLACVGGDSLLIGSSDTGNNKRLVNIHPTADWVNNFEHNTSPLQDS